MRRLLILALVLSPLLPAAEPDWENPAVFRRGKLPARATAMPFPDRADALAKPRLESPWCQLLNGPWKFHYSGNLEGLPAGFEQENFDASAWKEIPVPSNWQLQNYGIPLYSGTTYPFAENPPKVTAEPPANYTHHAPANRHPVGSYRRTFTLPADWTTRRTMIAFEGVDSAFSLWVNGKEIGYSEDSRTTAQFDITAAVKPGENIVAIQVHQYSDGSYLESQDTWKLSGIYRDVFLWSSPLVELTDHHVMAGLDDSYAKGTLRVAMTLKNHDAAPRPGKLKFELMGADGVAIFTKEAPFDLAAGAGSRVEFAGDSLSTIQPWSAEKPTLYPYLLTVSDATGQPIAHFAGKTGFRRDEVKNGRFLHNGQPILIKGVIRQDHHVRNGHTLKEADFSADLLQMKRANINAIRTANAPNDPRFLELCDELGLYVFAGANTDSRGMGDDSLTKDPAWLEAHLDRVKNVVERDKNHPSIVYWSPGTTKGDGPNLAEGAKWIRQIDPSRPTESDLYTPEFLSPPNALAYCREEEKKDAATQRPLIQNASLRAGGNGLGGLGEYSDLFGKEPLLQGGFISEWKDQGLIRISQAEGSTSRRFTMLYGGDFGDLPNAGTSCLNGLVSTSTTSAKWEEVKSVYQDVRTSLVKETPQVVKIRISNDRFFRPMDDVKVSWKLLKDGKEIGQGNLALPIVGPRQSAELDIPTNQPAGATGDFILRVRYDLNAATAWNPAGMPIAWNEFILPWGKRTAIAPHPSTTAASFTQDASTVKVTAGEVTATVDRTSGALVSMKLQETEILRSPLRLDFWRAPTSNDRGTELDRKLAIWREAGRNARATDVQAAQTGNDVTITAQLAVPAGTSTAKVVYRITGAGQIGVEVDFKPDPAQPMIPRIGMTCALPASASQWTWYGKGLHENYADRNRSAWTAIQTGSVGPLSPIYALPQESGNRMDVRWATFDSPTGGGGLRIDAAGDSLLEIGATPFSTTELESAKHSGDLQPGDSITLHLDHRQMGLGGTNIRDAMPSPAHRLGSDRSYRWSMLLTATYRKPAPAQPPQQSPGLLRRVPQPTPAPQPIAPGATAPPAAK